MPYAYDPITGEDVQFDDCHPVHAAESADDLSEEVVEILQRDFRHDPVEGCQGTYVLIVADECPYCGCNRLNRAVDTLADVGHTFCAVCGRGDEA